MHRRNLIITLTTCLFLVCCILGTYSIRAQGETRKHVVEAIDNYYSLSLKYDVSVEELKLANPGVTNPKPGDVLIIPRKGSLKAEPEAGDCSKNSRNKREVYHIALMLPLYLEQVADTLWRESLDPVKINELAPFRFIQFYHGFMLAADSLRQKGLNVEIHVYDIDNQSSKVHHVLAEPELKKMDLIVGPFFKNSFASVAEFARENEIPIINPLSSRPDILQGNPYVFKLLPSVESQPQLVADLVRRDFSDYRIILYVANKYQNAELIGQYTDAIERLDQSGKKRVKVLDYAADSIQGFRDAASHTQPNLVIIYAENEVLPAALLSKLSAFKSDYDITVIGLPEWEKYTNIESNYLIALNSLIFISSFTNYRSDAVQGFIRAYRAKYFDEPLYYACSGFDAGFYFMNALMDYGRGFKRCLDDIRIPLIQNQYHFVRKGDGGYDNTYWNILQYSDYFLLKKTF
jgi:ABC-type branched-subunit amino acid transport system substrate-binding protein